MNREIEDWLTSGDKGPREREEVLRFLKKAVAASCSDSVLGRIIDRLDEREKITPRFIEALRGDDHSTALFAKLLPHCRVQELNKMLDLAYDRQNLELFVMVYDSFEKDSRGEVANVYTDFRLHGVLVDSLRRNRKTFSDFILRQPLSDNCLRGCVHAMMVRGDGIDAMRTWLNAFKRNSELFALILLSLLCDRCDVADEIYRMASTMQENELSLESVMQPRRLGMVFPDQLLGLNAVRWLLRKGMDVCRVFTLMCEYNDERWNWPKEHASALADEMRARPSELEAVFQRALSLRNIPLTQRLIEEFGKDAITDEVLCDNLFVASLNPSYFPHLLREGVKYPLCLERLLSLYNGQMKKSLFRFLFNLFLSSADASSRALEIAIVVANKSFFRPDSDEFFLEVIEKILARSRRRASRPGFNNLLYIVQQPSVLRVLLSSELFNVNYNSNARTPVFYAVDALSTITPFPDLCMLVELYAAHGARLCMDNRSVLEELLISGRPPRMFLCDMYLKGAHFGFPPPHSRYRAVCEQQSTRTIIEHLLLALAAPSRFPLFPSQYLKKDLVRSLHEMLHGRYVCLEA